MKGCIYFTLILGLVACQSGGNAKQATNSAPRTTVEPPAPNDSSNEPTASLPFDMVLSSVNSAESPQVSWTTENEPSNTTYKCEVQRIHYLTGQVQEQGPSEPCTTPLDLASPTFATIFPNFAHARVKVSAFKSNGDLLMEESIEVRRASIFTGRVSSQVGSKVGALSLLPSGDLLYSSSNQSLADSKSNLRASMARVNLDGSIDLSTESFMKGFNGPVSDLKVLSDDSIIAVGAFTHFAGEPAPGLVKLSSIGQRDLDFQSCSLGASSISKVIPLQSGKIILTGTFQQPCGWTPSNGMDTNPVRNIIRLNADGSFDPSFYTISVAVGGNGLDSVGVIGNKVYWTLSLTSNYLCHRPIEGGWSDAVCSALPGSYSGFEHFYVIQELPNNKIILAGSTNRQTPAGTNIKNVLVLNSDLSVDEDFASHVGTLLQGQVNGLDVDSTGRIVLIGPSTATSIGAVRLLANGTPDPSFAVEVSTFTFVRPYDVKVTSSGKILLAGNIDRVGNNIGSSGLILLADSGAVDSQWIMQNNAGFDGTVLAIDQQSDGRIIAGGNFTGHNLKSIAPSASLLKIAAFEMATSNTASSALNRITSPTNTIAVADNGEVILGATSSNSLATYQMISKLQADLSFLNTFGSSMSGLSFGSRVTKIHSLSDGTAYVAGTISAVNGTSVSKGIVKLLATGAKDSTFNLGVSTTTVEDFVVRDDGTLIIVGSQSGGIFAINSDGSAHVEFNTNRGVGAQKADGLSGSISAIALLSDGKILLGGDFVSFNNFSQSNIVRLNSDGSIDTSFTPQLEGRVESLLVDDEDRVLVSGLRSGKLGYLRRFDTNGVEDNVFATNILEAGYARAHKMIQLPSKKIAILGDFISKNPVIANTLGPIVRILEDGRFDASFKN